jgi:uncharacterized protein RhaS with RHS repeats
LKWPGARWFDPKLGRFISEDPIGFAAGDANLSRYVGNSSANANDPSGLDTIDTLRQRLVQLEYERKYWAAMRESATLQQQWAAYWSYKAG